MPPDLSVRAVEAVELMDAPDADRRMLERTYERFAQVNAVVSRWRQVYRKEIRPLARKRPLRILDIGAGGGDLSRALARWLRRDGLSARIVALDADARAIEWATAHDTTGEVEYRCALSTALVAEGELFDIVLSNHLLHHLKADELASLLEDSRRLALDDGLILHRDIARSRAAYLLFAVGTAPFARNLLGDSFIRADGLTSIRRAYKAHELAAVTPPGWSVRQSIPARLSLRWERQHA